ncbi:unnamed protein product [Cutaneotrichosporon oleaginosum]
MDDAPPSYSHTAPLGPASAGAAPPQYSASKRLVLWCADGGRRRARDLTHDLAPPTAMRKFSLDNQNITHVRHGDDGCSLTPRAMGYVLSGKVEMWSAAHRTQEYHWGGEPSDCASHWRLRIHPNLVGAREVRTGKPDRGLRAALTADGCVAAWHVESAEYAAVEEECLSRLPALDHGADVSFKEMSKAEDGMHWVRWATAAVSATAAAGRKQHTGRVLDFDVGNVVVALKENGEVWVCGRTLEWRILCVVEQPKSVKVVARGSLVGLYRLPSDDQRDRPTAYVAHVDARYVRVYPVRSEGEGAFVEMSLHPTSEGYQGSARTQSGEVHAWAHDSEVRSASASVFTESRPPSRDTASSRASRDDIDVSFAAPQVTGLIELPHTRETRLFPVSVGVGCALCVMMDPEERDRKRRGLMMGLGLLGKSRGKERAL